MSINLIDKILEGRGKSKKGKTIRLASEPDEFEVIELPSLIMEFNDWLIDNPSGTWKQFMSTDSRVKLDAGGDVESYADLIDAFEKGIDVMVDETLTDYIKRIRYSEMLEAVRKK
tara:strand:- start:114 stop:458 length:345 start_codon:yes stop_codon:yes gene_type:complete